MSTTDAEALEQEKEKALSPRKAKAIQMWTKKLSWAWDSY
jgi:hypothetical protein